MVAYIPNCHYLIRTNPYYSIFPSTTSSQKCVPRQHTSKDLIVGLTACLAFKFLWFLAFQFCHASFVKQILPKTCRCINTLVQVLLVPQLKNYFHKVFNNYQSSNNSNSNTICLEAQTQQNTYMCIICHIPAFVVILRVFCLFVCFL